MATYEVHTAVVTRARQLIEARQYVLDSGWGDVQPSSTDENVYLDSLAAHDLLQLLDRISA